MTPFSSDKPSLKGEMQHHNYNFYVLYTHYMITKELYGPIFSNSQCITSVFICSYDSIMICYAHFINE